MNSIEPVKHHPFSPSSLDRIAACRARWKNCRGFKQKESEHAQRGRLLHRAVYTDEVLPLLSSEDRDMILALRSEHVAPFSRFETYHELPVDIRNRKGRIITKGTLDFLVISRDGTSASVKDWKFGQRGVAEASSNLQLKPYVIGVFQKFPCVQRVYVMVVQPDVSMQDYEHQYVFDRSGMNDMIDEIENVIELAKTADLEDLTQYSCSPDNCLYCNTSGCRKYKQTLEDAAKAYGVQTIPPGVPSTQLVDYCDDMLCKAAMLDKMIAERKTLFKNVILANGGSEHYSVRKGRMTTKTDWKAVAEKYNLTPDMIAPYTSSTIGDPYVAERTRSAKKTLPVTE